MQDRIIQFIKSQVNAVGDRTSFPSTLTQSFEVTPHHLIDLPTKGEYDVETEDNLCVTFTLIKFENNKAFYKIGAS